MRLVMHKEWMVEMRNLFRMFIGKGLGKNHLGDISSYGRSYKL
jgi:hypothetical protein